MLSWKNHRIGWNNHTLRKHRNWMRSVVVAVHAACGGGAGTIAAVVVAASAVAGGDKAVACSFAGAHPHSFCCHSRCPGCGDQHSPVGG